MIAHRVFAAFVFVAALASNAAADANSLNDYLGPREVGIGEAMRADASGASSLTLNPAGLVLNSSVVFEGSYGFRPGDSASSVNIAACDSTVPVPGCFYYRYFTAKPELSGQKMARRAHEFGMSVARAITPNIGFGVTNRYFDYNSDLEGEEDSSGFGVDAGFLFRASNWASAALVGYNLLSEDSAQYPRAIGSGLTVRPLPTMSLSADAVWNLDGPDDRSTGRYGFGGQYFFSSSDRMSGFPIRGGGVFDRELDSAYVTAGLGFVSTKVGVDIGGRKQLDGGDELMILGSIRLFGPSGQ